MPFLSHGMAWRAHKQKHIRHQVNDNTGKYIIMFKLKFIGNDDGINRVQYLHYLISLCGRT